MHFKLVAEHFLSLTISLFFNFHDFPPQLPWQHDVILLSILHLPERQAFLLAMLLNAFQRNTVS